MGEFNYKQYLKENILLKEDNLEAKSAGKKLFAAFKKEGLKPNYIANDGDIRKLSKSGEVKDMVHIEPGEESIKISIGSQYFDKPDTVVGAIESAGFEISDQEDNVGDFKLTVFTVPVGNVAESLNESAPGFYNRKMGEPLPTLDSVREEYESNSINEDEFNNELIKEDISNKMNELSNSGKKLFLESIKSFVEAQLKKL